ncbi:AMP-binding protein, partial [Corallococcus sp. AS-1-12]|uniref:non-ribosomal peptide synthetase n=1 Tax=Corallococcus sp. AS-1-12 TaxID=2874598 RepID=UPI001CBB0C05
MSRVSTLLKARLDGYADGLELPSDYLRTSSQTWRAATLHYRYPSSVVRGVAELGWEHQTTLFTSLVAGLAVVLNRYTGREDVCVGTTTASPGQEGALGGLNGTSADILPLRLDLSGAPSLGEVLRRTKAAVERQTTPSEQAPRRQRDNSQTAFGAIIVRHQRSPTSEGERSGERTTASEQDWQFYGDGSSLELVLEYAADLFSEKTVRRMVEHHQRVLEALVEGQPEVRLLTEEEEGLYEKLNDTSLPLEETWSLAETFERQVRATPDAVACIGVDAGGGHRQLTYRQLNARANQVARRLRALGVGAETRVAVLSERSPELLVAMLAIFKAGGCYVPVDPAYPRSYIEQILADATPQVVLGRRGHAEGTRVDVWLDEPHVEADGEEAARPASGQLACLMYTSGSTGKPKGVMVPFSQL